MFFYLSMASHFLNRFTSSVSAKSSYPAKGVASNPQMVEECAISRSSLGRFHYSEAAGGQLLLLRTVRFEGP